MARSPRNDVFGGWHHVMNRGARRQAIFLDEPDRQFFLGLLPKIHDRFGVETHAYCLMGNHYHLLLHCPRADLSSAMRLLGSAYTRRFNMRHGFDGPLCRSRFHSVEVASDHHLLEVTRYIHLNPLDFESSVNLVEYEWSSYAAYLRRRVRPTWLHSGFVLSMLGDDRDRYQRYVDADRRPGSFGAYPASPSSPARAATPARNAEAHGSAALARLGVVEATVDSVALAIRSDPHVRAQSRRNLPRSIVLALARSEADVPTAVLAQRFALESGSIRKTVSNLRKLASVDQEVAAAISECRQALRQVLAHDLGRAA